jgi:hypothetical protein
MAAGDCHAGDAQVSMQISRKGAKTARRRAKKTSNIFAPLRETHLFGAAGVSRYYWWFSSSANFRLYA